MGNLVILPVCTSVTASNSSSSVPKPPGNTTKACEYLTNMVLRTKKYLNSRPMSTNSFRPCSCGNSMPRPTEIPCALAAPLLAASMMPGPPPVSTAYPALASAAVIWVVSSYCAEPGRAREEPNTDTALPISASSPNPSTNSFFFQAEDGIRVKLVTGVQTCALPISDRAVPALAIAFLGGEERVGAPV